MSAEFTDADADAVLAAVHDAMPALRADLEHLIRIPSVSASAFDPVHVQESADAVLQLFREAGLPEVEILRATDPQTGKLGAPAVVGHRPARDGAPTVLLYAHHDVQPPGRPADWQTPAFEPTERNGRLYARGAADDKAGVCVHLAAVRTLAADSPLGLTVFVEGEEEVGSPSFDAFLETYRDRLAADVMIVADSGNWRVDVPALTTSLRGNAVMTMTVSTLDHALHSGMFGGAAPDAALALVRTVNSLWDEAGNLAVPGLGAGEASLDYPEADFRADAGVLEGVSLIGTGSIATRLWHRPSITVTGTDLPSLGEASNTLQGRASAKLSLRFPPGQDGAAAVEAVTQHLRDHAPWGARVEVTCDDLGAAWSGQVEGEIYEAAQWALKRAWGGVEPVQMGMGGSIPFIASLKQVFPDAVVLLTGVEDPDTRAHGANESLHLGEFERACAAEALLLSRLGR